VQGLTGGQGRFYGLRNRAYGTKVVGGVSPKKAGTDVDGIPVFASVKEAVAETGATATMVIVPAPAAADAVLEAAEAGIELFVADAATKAVIMFGEIGGSAEEEAAEFIKARMSKPVVSYVAGVTAPPGKKMGHAGAIISGSKGTAQAKMAVLEDAGVRVATNPTA